jgi:hypothetical protein
LKYSKIDYARSFLIRVENYERFRNTKTFKPWRSQFLVVDTCRDRDTETLETSENVNFFLTVHSCSVEALAKSGQTAESLNRSAKYRQFS